MTSAFLGYMLGLLNPPNRRIRFRMYGGVGGAESRDSPLSRLTASWRGGYQRYIRILNLTNRLRGLTVCQRKFQFLQLTSHGRELDHRLYVRRRAASEGQVRGFVRPVVSALRLATLNRAMQVVGTTRVVIDPSGR
jgi:hypothetical protein